VSAILSPCGLYRYRLERHIHDDAGPVFAFFGVNPSTADARIDDATVRKWQGFVWRWKGPRFIVGNVFAYRATDVKELRRAMLPVGPDNFAHLERIAADADVLVPCWGNRSKVSPTLHHHFDKTLTFLRSLGKPVRSFGLTASGDPKHPLMLGYDTVLQPFGGVNNGE
jgi:hypothetical protein